MHSLIRILTLVLATSGTVANARQPDPKRYALLVAVTKDSHSAMNKPPLAYPEIDAKDVGKFLSEHGYEVDYLLGPKATKPAIEAKLQGLSSKGNEGGVCLVGL